MFYPVLIHANSIPELSVWDETDNGVLVGAGMNLSRLDLNLKSLVAQLPTYKTRVFQAIIEMLRWFAGPQIRNVAVSSYTHVYMYTTHVVFMCMFTCVYIHVTVI